MKVFVTGASGFVGGHVAETLAKRHAVSAMVRSEASAKLVLGYGAAAVRCSLDDVAPEHVRGVDAVVHCAARAEEWGTREEFWSANVEGTRRMLAAAKAAGVRRFVHIGTEAALFDGGDLVDVDETRPYPARHRFLYSETKAEAERLVLGANAEAFATISIRPRFVWGPRDQSVLPAMMRMVEGGQFAWIGGGRSRTSTTHVVNCVHAVDLALERGRGGEAYFATDGEITTLREFLTKLLATQGVTPPDRALPASLARLAAAGAETVWRLLRLSSTPPLTRFAACMMSSTVTIDDSKARRELGYEPVISVADGLTQLERGRAAGRP